MSEHRSAARYLAGLTVAAAVVIGFAAPAQAADTGWNGTRDTGWNGTSTGGR